MSKRIGAQTVALPSKPGLIGWAGIAGQKEKEGCFRHAASFSAYLFCRSSLPYSGGASFFLCYGGRQERYRNLLF